MRAREPDPIDAWNAAHPLQERGEVARRVVGRLVVIDDLTQQLNFPMTRARRLPGFGDDVGGRPHPLVPARVRHDAERAELVAPFDDRDARADGIGVPGDTERKRDVVVRIDVHDLPARAHHVIDDLRKLLQPLGADDDVDRPVAAQQRRAFLLRHATHHGDDPSTPLRAGLLGFRSRFADFAEPRVELLGRALSHAARVDDDEIGAAPRRSVRSYPSCSSSPETRSESWKFI